MIEPRKMTGQTVSVVILIAGLIGAYFIVDYVRDKPSEKADGTGSAVLTVSDEQEEKAEGIGDSESDLASPDQEHPAYAGSGNESGIEDFQPSNLYSKYLSEAAGGNLDAQYVLVTALRDCLRVPKTEEEIAELERSGVSDEVVRVVANRFHRCIPLHTTLPNLEAEYEQWYRAARDAQHPLILVKQRRVPLERKKQLVKQALTGSYPEPYLYAEVYGEAAILYREYPENLDKFREEAWLLLYCEASLHCDSQATREHLRTVTYHQHDYDEIVALEASIRDAIERRDWDVLVGL